MRMPITRRGKYGRAVAGWAATFAANRLSAPTSKPMAMDPIRGSAYAGVTEVVNNTYMMKCSVFFFVILMLFITPCLSQDEKDVKSVDTIHLPGIKFKKTLAYSLGSVTILIDYNSFMDSYNGFWKMYKKGMRGVKREQKKGEYINPDYAPRFYLLDSMRTVLTTQIKQKDTVYISDYTFGQVGIGSGHDFTVDIEARKC